MCIWRGGGDNFFVEREDPPKKVRNRRLFFVLASFSHGTTPYSHHIHLVTARHAMSGYPSILQPFRYAHLSLSLSLFPPSNLLHCFLDARVAPQQSREASTISRDFKFARTAAPVMVLHLAITLSRWNSRGPQRPC